MEDLTSKKMFKIMSVLSQYEIVWDMKKEYEIPKTDNVYLNLEKFIDIEKWVQEYYFYYKKWLYEDFEYIYDISSSINQDMLKAITEYNKFEENKLFYWFDVDRDKNAQFEWKLCPISQTELILLGDEFHPNNRLISSVYPLVFPQIK